MRAVPITALATRWRIVRTEGGDAAFNMAVDAALLAHARRTGETTLRVYAWERPSLSFGRNERTRGLFDPARIEAAGVDVVRRPTGGRALLHHRECTYSVTAPDRLPLAESYAAINALLLEGLARLGVAAAAAPRAGRPLRPEGAACFAEPGAGELVVEGAKLVGSAQLREEGALLQHGSILLADDQPMIASLRTEPVAVSPAATLERALGRPVDWTEVAVAITTALRAAVMDANAGDSPGAPPPVEPLDLGPLVAEIAGLRARFRDPAWTWRR